jgi:DNA polymerase-3 subunit gamma/tau
MAKETTKPVSETALYRKYRPARFADVHGQDHIVKVLEGSIESGRISHAYLFCGSRGTGKTSIARIFARALKTSDNDIYEIDAASNRGIDDIRAIRDAVNVLPFESTYKVYIIDEVHMLTKEAFNALLKTLEEPPAHAIFILATTEMDKLPETVVSRCQTFTFKKPTREVLRELIGSVAKKEGFALEAGASDLIALLGDGSFRDTLGMLQKVMSGNREAAGGKDGKKILVKDVEMVAGAPKNSVVNAFVTAFAAGDVPASLAAVSEADKAGIDMNVFLTLVLEKARFILLVRSGAKVADIEERVSEEDFLLIKTIGTDPKNHISSKTLAELLRASDETSRVSIQTLPLELAVLRAFS